MLTKFPLLLTLVDGGMIDRIPTSFSDAATA